MIRIRSRPFVGKALRFRGGVFGCLLLALATLAGPVWGMEPDAASAAKPAARRCGLYLHACWTYNYPFALRTWQRKDYNDMFQLLKHLGYNTVMFWPCAEAVPAPISAADRHDLTQFREIIEDGHKYGLETWLVLCAVTSNPAIAAKPWMQRSLFTQMNTVRLDNPQEAEAFLKHRANLIEILNNADGYVLIDGDPGSYPGAKPADFVKVCLHDRQTIDRVGTHPKTQKVIPWLWSGWGIKKIWGEPIAPYTAPTLEALKRQMQEPWELLPGCGYGPGVVNVELVHKAGLLGRSTLLFYNGIEQEPSQPGAKLQFDVIRDSMRKESPYLSGSRGLFGNVQTGIMVLPEVYFFARCAADSSYANRPDAKVLTDLAQLLGGPSDLLIPAWSCLRRGLDTLPADLPAKLRAATLSGRAASFLPGGAARYLNILANQVDSRIRVLQACQRPANTPAEAAAAIADGITALVDWWKLHRFVFGGAGGEPFRLFYVGQFEPLKAWCAKNVTDPASVSKLAVKKLVARGTLAEPDAVECMRDLLGK